MPSGSTPLLSGFPSCCYRLLFSFSWGPSCPGIPGGKSKDPRPFATPSHKEATMQSITALALLLAATTFADASRASSWRHPSLLRRSFRRLNHPRRTTSTFDDTSSTTAAAPGSTRSGIGGRAPSPLHSAVFCTRGGDGGNGPCIGIDLGESRLPSRCNLNFSSSRSRFRSGVYVPVPIACESRK